MSVTKALRGISLLACLFLLAPDPAVTHLVDAAPAAPAQLLLVVNTSLDYEDCNPGNGACDPGTWNMEHTVCTPAPNVCTLRAAIQECNASVGVDEIKFNSVAQPIRPISALPYITEAIIINGIDIALNRSVRLDGLNVPPGANGLHLWTSNSTIRGMTVTGFQGTGTENGFGIVVDGDNNVIEGNYLGTNATGQSGLGNGNSGLIIADGADDNSIGGTTPAQRNVISGNEGHGIQIGNALNNVGASNNRIIGNYIGIAPDGETVLGNGYTGVSVFYATSTNNQIGGTASGERNIIAGNGQHGVGLDDGTSGNVVLGNYIGTNASGTVALPNVSVGVRIHQSSNNTVGGITAAARNIIAASGQSGIEISVPPFMTTDASSTTMAETSLISYGLRRDGESLAPVSASTVPNTPADGNVVQGNYIGLDVSGTQALSNGGNGIIIHNASQNQIGGTAAGARNVIAGNWGNGVVIQTDGGYTASGNLVQSNYIGLDATGLASLANNYNGVVIYNASQNFIGGTAVGAGNVIAGNAGNGISIQASGGGAAEGNRVQGNLVGLDASGMTPAPNGYSGVMVYDASQNIIGGTEEGAGNIIASNGENGVTLQAVGGAVMSNTVQGNVIGAYRDGSFSDPDEVPGSGDDPGNGFMGVGMDGAVGSQIGGATLAARNIIVGNAFGGMYVFGVGATGNQIQGNFIGLLVDKTPAGNGGSGVWISEGSRNLIGGMGAATNTVAFNDGPGVLITDNAIGNTLQGNAIYLNAERPVDLDNDGFTPNDLGDVDAGANLRQNFPTILGTKGTVVTGTLSSAPNTVYRIDFYAYEICDFAREFPVGYGDGEQYLAFKNVTTDARGNAAFTVLLPSALPAGYTVAAIATDPEGNTSEFSNSPYKLRASSSSFIPQAAFNPYPDGVPEMHVLLYGALDELQAAALKTCGLKNVDMYVVVDGDTAAPRKMTNDGAGRIDRVQADFIANDVHHSLWFTPTAAITYTLELYVVEAGRPFTEALLSDAVTLTPNPQPHLVVLTDLRELFKEFNLTSANSATQDRNANHTLDYYEAVERIRVYAAAHQGVVLDARQDAYTDDFNYTNADHRSLMYPLINWLVARLPTAQLKYLAIVGDDAVVPFYRLAVSPGSANEAAYPNAHVQRPLYTGANPTLLDMTVGGVKGQWMSDIPYGTFTTDLPARPRLDIGLGRIYLDSPQQLVDLIDALERPINLQAGQSRVFIMNTRNELDGVQFHNVAEDSFVPPLKAHFGSLQRVILSPRFVSSPYMPAARWVTGEDILAPHNLRWNRTDIGCKVKGESDLLILAGHGEHWSIQDGDLVVMQSDNLANELITPYPCALVPSTYRLLVSAGCHNGLSLAYSNYDADRWLAMMSRRALSVGAAFYGSTSFDTGWHYYGDYDYYHDRLRHLFLDRLFNPAYSTLGDALKAAHNAYSPWFHDDNDRKVLYTVVLYGLPTQPVQAAAGGAARALTVQQVANAPAVPTVAAQTLDRSISIDYFEVLTDSVGRNVFAIPYNGSLGGVNFAPILPLVQHAYILPAGTMDLYVTLTFSHTYTYPRPVRLAPLIPFDKSLGALTGTYTVTTPYPAAVLDQAIYTDALGTHLEILLTPLQYDPGSGLVTLYDRLDYRISYSAPSTYTIQNVLVNAGEPMTVDQAGVPITVTLDLTAPFSGFLSWEIRDVGGVTLDSGESLLDLPGGVYKVGFHGVVEGLDPGPKQILVALSTSDADGDAVVQTSHQQEFIVFGRSLEVGTDASVYGPDSVATITARVRDETGAPVAGQADYLSQRLDGSALPLTWYAGDGYIATLDLSSVVTGQHILSVTLAGGRQAKARFLVDRDPPVSMLSSPVEVRVPAIPVTITGADDLSGVASYRLQYRVGETGVWTDWLTRETTWNYDLGVPADLASVFGPAQPVVLEDGVTYYFRVQAVDWAGNVETLHPDADAWTQYIKTKYVYLPLVMRAYDSSIVPPTFRYVKRYGLESGDCRTPATACGTIQYAVDVAQDGDVIAIAGYADVYTLDNPGGDPRLTYWQTSYRPKPDGYYGLEKVTQVVLVNKSLTLRGGYAVDFSKRDPATYKTVLRPGVTGGAGRGVLIAPFVAVTLEDLYILEGDATDLGGAYHSIYGYHDAGGGVHALGVSYRKDALIIRNCVIAGNRASEWSYAEGGGVYIENRSGAQLTGNLIYGNTATGGEGQGGGVLVRGGAGVQLEANIIISNTGSVNGNFQGGGMCLYGLVNPVIRGNTIAANVGTESGARVLGGGLYLDSVAGALISGNVIRDNVGGGYEVGAGGGLSMYKSQNVTVRGNTIVGNIAAFTGATGSSSRGGGVRISAGCANIALENNVIARNQVPYGGSGILITPASGENLVVTLRHNTIADNRVSEAGIENRESRIANQESVDPRLGELANDESRMTNDESQITAVLKESQGIMTLYNVTLNAVNTIIAGHTRGILELFPGEGTLNVNFTLWDANTYDADPTVTRNNDRFGDPAFVDPAGGDYHIGASSAARDAGLNVGVTTDIDGDVRDASPDIGADEYK